MRMLPANQIEVSLFVLCELAVTDEQNPMRIQTSQLKVTWQLRTAILEQILLARIRELSLSSRTQMVQVVDILLDLRNATGKLPDWFVIATVETFGIKCPELNLGGYEALPADYPICI